MSLRGSCCIVALNKSDLPVALEIDDVKDLLPGPEIRVTSAATGHGLEELKDLIVLSVSGSTSVDEDFNTTERQVEELRKALELAEGAMDAVSSGAGLDASLEMLSRSRKCLSRILGTSADEELLERIFSGFCIGK